MRELYYLCQVSIVFVLENTMDKNAKNTIKKDWVSITNFQVNVLNFLLTCTG